MLFYQLVFFLLKKKKIFMNLNKEESANLVETVGNTLVDSTIAFGTVGTGIVATNVSSGKALTVSLGAISTMITATGLKIGSKIIADNIRKAPDSLEDNNRPPSPGEITEALKCSANSPLEKFWNWFDVTFAANPEYALLIIIYLLTIFNFLILRQLCCPF